MQLWPEIRGIEISCYSTTHDFIYDYLQFWVGNRAFLPNTDYWHISWCRYSRSYWQIMIKYNTFSPFPFTYFHSQIKWCDMVSLPNSGCACSNEAVFPTDITLHHTLRPIFKSTKLFSQLHHWYCSGSMCASLHTHYTDLLLETGRSSLEKCKSVCWAEEV